MFMRNGVSYEFHHIGIPSRTIRAGERYSAALRMYTSDSACELARIQFHRFDAGCPLDPLLQNVPHPAFKVDNLHRAIEGMIVLLGPYEPIDGLRVAVVADGGMPVELIETTLSDEQIWARAKSGRDAPLYAAPALHAMAEPSRGRG